eukprot:gene4754-8336_t
MFQKLKDLELCLDLFEEKYPQVHALLDTFLDQAMDNQNEMKEEITLVSTLVENLISENPESQQFQTYQKRVIRILKNFTTKTEKEVQVEKQVEEKNLSDIDPSIPVFTSQDFYGLLVESQNKIEELRALFEIQNLKRKKGQELMEICESVAQYTSLHLNITQIVHQKLQQILDGLIMIYGGYGFCAPLNIPQNQIIGAENKEQESTEEFLYFITSSSAKEEEEKMKANGISSFPNLSKCLQFNQIIISRKFKILQNENLKLPKNHMPLQNTMILPVVINKTTVALVGLTGGTFTELDGEVVFDVLPDLWQNVAINSVEKANKTNENINRLRMIEKRLEFGKKLTISLSNILKEDDEAINQKNLTRRKLLAYKLRDMANFLEMTYGGMVFIAPTCAPMNKNFLIMEESDESSGFDVEIKEDEFQFMTFVFSAAAMTAKKAMAGLNLPDLKKTKHMLQVVKEKTPLLIENGSAIKLPPKHYPLHNCLLVPIVVNNSTVALVSLSNGKYSEIDGNVLQDVLSTSWLSLLQECFAKLDLRFKEDLLSQTLPDFMVKQIQQSSSTNIANECEKVSIIFSDFVQFTNFSKGLPPFILVEFLNTIFTRFDDNAKKFNIEKIKTIGDGYMAAGGVSNTNDNENHAYNACLFGLSMVEVVEKFNKETNHHDEIKKRLPLQIRIGIATGGPIVAGIIGNTKLQYDLWGEIVNLASRMESSGVAMKVQISEGTFQDVKDYFNVQERGEIDVKGIGNVQAFILESKK